MSLLIKMGVIHLKDKNKELIGLSYTELIERGLSQLPPEIKTQKKFEVPKFETSVEAGRTIIVNWKDIVSKITLDQKLLLRFLEHRLGTVGWITGNKAYFQGKFQRIRLNKHLDFFIREYIICDVCNRPDTELKKEKGQLIKKCNACGAWRVVEKI